MPFGGLTVNHPSHGEYILSHDACAVGKWFDSDLTLPGGVPPGGTVFYDGDGKVPLFRMHDFKGNSRDKPLPAGIKGTGKTLYMGKESDGRELVWVTEDPPS